MSNGLEVIVKDNVDDIAESVVKEIADVIKEKNQKGEKAVIAFPTGNTQLPIYAKLREWYDKGKIDFSNVIAFNLDEYYGLKPNHPQSYNRYLKENLFNHVNIKKRNLHLMNGRKKRNVEKYCKKYEAKIEKYGGIDLLLHGFGSKGHIAFCEESSDEDSRTRLIELADSTREDAEDDFGGIQNVPTHAITMGIGTIMDVKRTIGIGTNKDKLSGIMEEIIHGPVTGKVPASYLQKHKNSQIYLTQELAPLSLK